MESIAAVFGLLAIVCLAAVVKPFGPFKKRWQALVVAIVLIGVTGTLMPTPPEGSNMQSPSNIASKDASSASPVQEAAPGERRPPETRWRYTTHRDEMRNADTHHACLNSTNELRFEFPYNGGSQAELCLRKSPQHGDDVFVTIDRGQFTCFMDCIVSVKFDDGEIQRYSAGSASDGSSDVLFVRNYARFVRELRGATRIVIEAEFFQAGNRQMVFNEASGLRWPPGTSEAGKNE